MTDLNTLVNTIKQADTDYYQNNQSNIADSEYDELKRRLYSLDPDHPLLNTVSGQADTKFGKVIHITPMLSLGNVFNQVDMQNWMESIEKKLDKEIEFICEPKYDGLSLSLLYVKGKLVTASTRGDGREGEDVTHIAKHIPNIPHVLNTNEDLLVRGEVVVLRNNFNRINKLREDNGKAVFKNTRNAASGILRRLEVNLDETHMLSFIPYTLVDSNLAFNTQSQTLAYLTSLGFNTDQNIIVPNFKALMLNYVLLQNERDTLNFDIDGMVVKVNNLEDQRTLGETNREPRWAIAFKFPAIEVGSRLGSVEWTMSKYGKLTPVANIDTVRIGGVDINKVNLYNVAEIMRLDIGINDNVSVIRAGEVIPKIVGVYHREQRQTIVIPTQCPFCNEPTVMDEKAINLYCTNVLCPERVVQLLTYFVSKEALDIKGFSYSTIKAISSLGLLETIYGIYKLNKYTHHLLTLPSFTQKRIDKLLRSIEQSKSQPFYRFLLGFSIPNLGVVKAKEFGEKFTSLEHFLSSLQNKDNFDLKDATTKIVLDYFSDPFNKTQLIHLTKLVTQGDIP